LGLAIQSCLRTVVKSQFFRAVVLWDSGRLAGLIAAAYPLKPHRTTTLVNLGEGNIDPQ